MLDKRAIINVILLLLYVAGFNFYLYELFYGSWEKLITKSFFYSITIITLTYLTIEDYMGYSTPLNKQYNIISKGVIIINFIIITLALTRVLINDRIVFASFNGSVFVLTIMIAYSGGRHGFFTK